MNKNLRRMLVIAVAFLFVTAPSFALKEINYDNYDFSQKSELLEKLKTQSDKLDERISELQKGESPQAVLDELKQAKNEINAAANKIERANEQSWEEVRGAVQHDMNRTQTSLFEAGGFADNYDYDENNDDWWKML